MTRKTLRPVLVLLLAAGLLAGCSRNDVGGSGDQGYVAGKGVITSVASADRKTPGPVEGSTLDGKQVALSDLRGRVVVVNVWGSWCPPCRAEAPMLGQAARDLAEQDVAFLGIDSRDPSKAAAQAFVREKRIPYPSIYDPSGKTLLAFRGTLSPNSIPSTIVIDPQGRVAGSVLGQVSRTTLDDLVDDARGGTGS
ncbi:MAG: TlpA family protein disulfide reductase [Nocardioidaceae bacterium]|nr:TlpA family protein disulfide reductase [Nocardioidaceae bacterium]NUS49571.1 TlpA family protein disulfide reductase [Nocardioidaceae bacterium]